MQEALIGIDLKQRAREFARAAHAGQVHRDGKDAVEHPLRVAEKFADDPATYAIACLHDVLEDCPTISVLHIGELFGVGIAEAVWALTRGPEESWNAYIRRVKGNQLAVLVKIADIEDNIARADEKFRAKMAMYTEALDSLSKILL